MLLFKSLLLIILIVAMGFIVLIIRSFEYMTISELKRQARSGNADAKKVYPVRSYNMQLWIVLWTALGLVTSSIVLLLHNLVGTYWTIIINVPLVVTIHAILPWSKRPKPSLHLAALVSPFLEKLLRLIFPIMFRIEKIMGNWVQPEPIMLIQSKEELLEILHHNAQEFDNVSRDELRIASHAITFGNKKIGEHMTSFNEVKYVKYEELLTPVVLGELHDSGFSRFPVYQGNRQHIVGTLLLRDAIYSKKDQFVKEVMRPEVFYINEQQTMQNVLNAFIKTKHHLFIVVNEYEDVVGIITIEDVLEQIVGKKMHDEFEQYENMREVANILTKGKTK